MRLAVLFACAGAFGCVPADGQSRASKERAPDVFETLASACSRGAREACESLATRLVSALNTSEQPSSARELELFDIACGGGVPEACSGLATGLLSRGRPEDRKRAVGILRGACEEGDALSCAKLAVALDLGIGGEVDPAAAVELFSRACELGDSDSCYQAGSLYLDEIAAESDSGVAGRFLQRGCDGGSGLACIRLAETIASAEESDARATALVAQGLRSLETDCDAQKFGACATLALLYRQHPLIPPDSARVLAALRRGCEAGDPLACEWLEQEAARE